MTAAPDPATSDSATGGTAAGGNPAPGGALLDRPGGSQGQELGQEPRTPLPQAGREAPADPSAPLPPLPHLAAPSIDLTLSADGLLLLGISAWLLWRRFLREVVLRRFGLLLGSEQNARSLAELLAQVAALTGAARVAILSCYVAPGRLPLDLETRTMPMERIRADVEDLLQNARGGWRLVEAGPHLPTPCSDYLLRNRIVFLYAGW